MHGIDHADHKFPGLVFGLNFLHQRSEKCPIEIVRAAFKLRHLVEAAVF